MSDQSEKLKECVELLQRAVGCVDGLMEDFVGVTDNPNEALRTHEWDCIIADRFDWMDEAKDFLSGMRQGSAGAVGIPAVKRELSELSRQQLHLVEHARSQIAEMIHEDVYFDEGHPCRDGCTIDHPMCYEMRIRRAHRDLEEILEPPVTVARPNRLRNHAERVFVEEWTKENARLNPNVPTTLEHILSESESEWHPVTLAEQRAVASVLMWLGTNVGRSFLERVCRRVGSESEFAKGFRTIPHGMFSRPSDPCKQSPRNVVLARVLQIIEENWPGQIAKVGSDGISRKVYDYAKMQVFQGVGEMVTTLIAVVLNAAGHREAAKDVVQVGRDDLFDKMVADITENVVKHCTGKALCSLCRKESPNSDVCQSCSSELAVQ